MPKAPKAHNIRWAKSDELVTPADIAKIVGRTPHTVRRAMSREDAPLDCELPQFLVWYLYYRVSGKPSKSDDGGVSVQERLLLLEEQEMTEKVRGRRLKNMKDLGEVISFDDAQRSFDDLLVSLKTNLLTIPERIAQGVASHFRIKSDAPTIDRVARLIESEINKHLEHVSGFEAKIEDVNLDVDTDSSEAGG